MCVKNLGLMRNGLPMRNTRLHSYRMHPQSGLASRIVKLKNWLASGGWIAYDRKC